MRKLFVLLAAGAFLVAFTLPAIAADWDFNGRVAFRTFIADDSEKSPGASGGKSDDDLHWGRMCDNSIGATVSAGDITGRFMYRPLEAHETIHDGDFAQLSASWDFGGGSLLIGKDLGPVNFFPSSQVYLDDMGLVGYGGIFTYFKPLMQLSVGNFKVALAEPETSSAVLMVGGNPSMVIISNPWAGNDAHNDPSTTTVDESSTTLLPFVDATGASTVDIDTSIPKIEVSYGFSAGPVSLSIMGGYQTYDEVNTQTDKSYSIDSHVFGVGFKIPLGAAYINGDIYTGTNVGQYHMTFQQTDANAKYDLTTDKIIDNDVMGYTLVVGFKASDTLTLEAGYGSIEQELDLPGTYEDDLSAYYVQANIILAEGVSVTPEIGMTDYGDTSMAAGVKTDQGDTTYFGARWQIVF